MFEWKTDALLSHLYDTLISFDPDGGLVPALAESWSQVSPTLLRLRLRRGVLFHNGEPFDADTVVWNFRKIRDMGPRYPRAFFFRLLRDVRRVGDYVVEMETQEPDAVLLYRLAAFSWMLPRLHTARVGMESLSVEPVGTGPYRFASWSASQGLRMDPWNKHWNGAPPFQDGLEWTFLSGPEQVRRLLAGELDLVGEVRPLFHRAIQEAPGIRVVKGDTLVEVALVFNTFSSRVKDVRVRRAIAASIHVPDLIRFVAQGNAQAMHGSGMRGQAFCLEDAEPALHFDPGGSLRLLEAAGVPRPLVLRGLLDGELEVLGRAIQSQLRKIGVVLQLEEGTREDLFRQVVLPKARGQLDWDRDLFLFATPDPTHHYYFVNVLAGASEGPFSLWANDEYDTLFRAFVREFDHAKAEQLVRRLDEITRSELPRLSLLHMKKGYGVADSLTFRPTRSGMLNLRFSRPRPMVGDSR